MKYLLDNQETERLKFRLVTKDDFESWVPLFNNKEVPLFFNMNPNTQAKELCNIWFKKVFERYENNLGGMNALIDKNSGKLIGQSGLLIQTVADIKRIEVAYSILPEYWNMGYASEASAKCRDFAFKNNLTDSLISIVHEDNTNSRKVALKNGMSLETQIKSDNKNSTKVFDVFSITRSEWEKKFATNSK